MHSLFQFKNNIMYYKEKISIPSVKELYHASIYEFYSTPVAGHSGLQPTLARLSASFIWPGIYKDVGIFVKKCQTREHNKYMPKNKGYYNHWKFLHKFGIYHLTFDGFYHSLTLFFWAYHDLGYLR